MLPIHIKKSPIDVSDWNLILCALLDYKDKCKKRDFMSGYWLARAEEVYKIVEAERDRTVDSFRHDWGDPVEVISGTPESVEKLLEGS